MPKAVKIAGKYRAEKLYKLFAIGVLSSIGEMPFWSFEY